MRHSAHDAPGHVLGPLGQEWPGGICLLTGHAPEVLPSSRIELVGYMLESFQCEDGPAVLEPDSD